MGLEIRRLKEESNLVCHCTFWCIIMLRSSFFVGKNALNVIVKSQTYASTQDGVSKEKGTMLEKKRVSSCK
jgi:hypothetical protein